MSWAALVPAAGGGTRLGHGPKAAVAVGGRSLLAWAVEALRPHVDEVVVALPQGLELPGDVGGGVRAILGGATRQDSVLRLLEAVDAEHVLVHDAARPFLGGDTVRAVQAAAQRSGAATVALPVADSLVRGAQGPQGPFWVQGMPREGLWAVQTPQGFRRELLHYAHAAAASEGFVSTDDAGLVARLGHTVELVPGDARLFKVTTAGDLALARALAAHGVGQATANCQNAKILP